MADGGPISCGHAVPLAGVVLSVLVEQAGFLDFRGDGLRLRFARTGHRGHERLAVVTQFVERFDDVGERAVAAVLRRTVEVDGRIPAAGRVP